MIVWTVYRRLIGALTRRYRPRRYRPERHYMRGPGPKWLERHRPHC